VDREGQEEDDDDATDDQCRVGQESILAKEFRFADEGRE